MGRATLTIAEPSLDSQSASLTTSWATSRITPGQAYDAISSKPALQYSE